MGNEGAINRFIRLFNETYDDDTHRKVANILGKIIVNKQQHLQVISSLKPKLKHKFNNKNTFNLDEEFYKLLWKCAQNLTYPEFYTAWHHQETPIQTSTPTPQSNLWQKLWQYLNRPIF
ncbi:hypothetical protein ACE1CD_34875 [Aerosakkonema sp. BLCC-F183]|uniref:hypothetical protein n=1 Tax=Aerosakkonema sp. BLCC-F183 TaxID=3342834 RepID=UPI0035B98CA0